MDQASTHDRVIRLVQEIARIREDNRQYFARGRHHQSEEILHGDRKARLVQILEELNTLAKKRLA